MATEKNNRFTVISNHEQELEHQAVHEENKHSYQSNPMYEKLMNFRNLQEQQKKRFSVDDLFKLC